MFEYSSITCRWASVTQKLREMSGYFRVNREIRGRLFSVPLERQAKPGRSYELKGVHSINCPFNRQPTERGSEQSDLARPRKANLRAVAKANPFRPRYTKTQAASPPESDEACCQRRSNGREQSLGLPG